MPGVIGYVEAGLELATQLLETKASEPDAIFVALGSGGTAAGLALGLAAAGVMTPVVAVRHTTRDGAARMARLARARRDRSAPLCSTTASPTSRTSPENLVIDEDEIGKGYGTPTPAGREAGHLMHEIAGLELDATYTEKAFASLVRAARGARRGQRLLFVDTLVRSPARRARSPSDPRRPADDLTTTSQNRRVSRRLDEAG